MDLSLAECCSEIPNVKNGIARAQQDVFFRIHDASLNIDYYPSQSFDTAKTGVLKFLDTVHIKI